MVIYTSPLQVGMGGLYDMSRPTYEGYRPAASFSHHLEHIFSDKIRIEGFEMWYAYIKNRKSEIKRFNAHPDKDRCQTLVPPAKHSCSRTSRGLATTFTVYLNKMWEITWMWRSVVEGNPSTRGGGYSERTSRERRKGEGGEQSKTTRWGKNITQNVMFLMH